MKLYSGPLSMYGAKAEIALGEKRLNYEVVLVPFSLRARYTPKHGEVSRINPKGQIPVLMDGPVEIFDSTLIFEYLEDRAPSPPLWPENIRQRAEARRLELEIDEVFFPNIISLMPLQADLSGPPAAAARAGAAAFYDRVEAGLGARDFLAGEAYTYADIAFIAAHFFAAWLGADISAHHDRIDQWRRRVIKRPAVARVLAPMSRFLASKKIAPPAFPQEEFMAWSAS